MRKGNHIHPRRNAEEAGPPPPLRVVHAAPAPRPVPAGDSNARLRPGAAGVAAEDYLSTLRPSGRRSMRARLDRAAGLLRAGSDASSFPWDELRYEHVAYVRTRLVMKGASASTVNMTLVALRQVASCVRRRHRMEPADEADIREVKNVKTERLPRGRMLTTEECDLLVSACARDRSPRGRRDAALVALALGAGLRREELAAVPVSSFNARARAVRLIGKGDKEASVPLQRGHVRAVLAWLRVRGRAAGPLLSPVTPEGEVTAGEQISSQAVYRAVLGRARKAGIDPCTPHDLRRTFISELLDVTDGETARELARHANFATTGKYNRRGERAKREAVEKLHDPYVKPAVRPRPRRPPRRAHKGRRRSTASLVTKPKRELVLLAIAHGVEGATRMTRMKLASAILTKCRPAGESG